MHGIRKDLFPQLQMKTVVRLRLGGQRLSKSGVRRRLRFLFALLKVQVLTNKTSFSGCRSSEIGGQSVLGTMSVNLFLVQISHFQGSKRWNEIDERRLEAVPTDRYDAACQAEIETAKGQRAGPSL